jgi:predicted unusual protein kinase regulating ubiquinone biosynthesis (AarF/ABC1/UbiB family)
MSDHDDDRVPRGFRARTLRTARLVGKLGAGFVARKLTGPLAPSAAISRADALVAELGRLKGLSMKIGQMASYLPGFFTPEAQGVLTKLQASSRALPWPAIAAVIEQELGGSIADRFEAIEEQPFAAASIGQVHRARVSGRDVAVKVQYPGVEEAIVGDLKLVNLFASLVSVGSAIDGDAMADELRARLLEECNYTFEAEWMRTFARYLAGVPGARVPAVIDSHSTRRVLTTELVHAQAFYPFCATAPQSARDRAGEIIFRACFDSLFRRGVYNADPHPGNYLFHPNGDVTFLDFGCVRRFDPDFIARWKTFARGIMAGDRAGFPARFLASGFEARGKFDWDSQWEQVLYLYKPFLSKTPFTYTDAYVQDSYDLLVGKNPNATRTGMPPEWLFVNRMQWGMNSVLASLGATAPWGAIFRAAIESPPIDQAEGEAAAAPARSCIA